MSKLHRFLSQDNGEDLTEYGLLAAFLSIVSIGVLRVIGYLATTLLRLHDAVKPSSF